MSDYTVRVHPLASRILPARDILVAVPPGYEAEPARRYPVLYCQDGQNLFGESAPSLSGDGWRLDQTAAALVASHAIERLLIVGIPNMADQRVGEYTLTANPDRQPSGSGATYAQYLVEEVKPFVDREYRTHAGPEHTGLGGSSFGALIALYVGLRFPHLFGRLALLSLAVGWDLPTLRSLVESSPPSATRIWLDTGTAEGAHIVDGARAVQDALLGAGWQEGADLRYYEAEGAQHTERAWAARMPIVLPYLFPPRPA